MLVQWGGLPTKFSSVGVILKTTLCDIPILSQQATELEIKKNIKEKILKRT